jgi:hypothetical protein
MQRRKLPSARVPSLIFTKGATVRENEERSNAVVEANFLGGCRVITGRFLRHVKSVT